MLADPDDVVRTREGASWTRAGRPWSLAPWARAGAVCHEEGRALLLELEGDWSDAFAADREAAGEGVLTSFARGRLAVDAPVGVPYRSASIEQEGARFALLPWIAGGTLASAQARARGGWQHDREVVATLALDLARGLGRTEALGSLAPRALIVGSDGSASVRGPLLDAIVKRIGGADPSALPYTAPESLRGEVTGEARLFSLGVMLHDLLTGSALFPDGAAGPRAIARWNAPSVARMPSGPEPLRNVLWLLLQRDPSRRGTPRAIVDLLAPLYEPSAAIATALLGETRTPVPYFG